MNASVNSTFTVGSDAWLQATGQAIARVNAALVKIQDAVHTVQAFANITVTATAYLEVWGDVPPVQSLVCNAVSAVTRVPINATKAAVALGSRGLAVTLTAASAAVHELTADLNNASAVVDSLLNATLTPVVALETLKATVERAINNFTAQGIHALTAAANSMRVTVESYLDVLEAKATSAMVQVTQSVNSAVTTGEDVIQSATQTAVSDVEAQVTQLGAKLAAYTSTDSNFRAIAGAASTVLGLLEDIVPSSGSIFASVQDVLNNLEAGINPADEGTTTRHPWKTCWGAMLAATVACSCAATMMRVTWGVLLG